MAYLIYNNDGTILTTIADGQVDSVSTSLDLLGKNLNNYGEYFNNNLIKLLTNFASSSNLEPRSPQIGQLWYNKTINKLTVYDGRQFSSAYGSEVSGTKPITTSTGDLWFDTINEQLNLWDGKKFKLIGPAVSSIYGKFGIEPPKTQILSNNFNIPQEVSVIYSYDSSFGFLSNDNFEINQSGAELYLNTSTTVEVKAGLTIFKNLDVKEDLYVNKNIIAPIKFLSINYDITYFGDPRDPTTSTALANVNLANNILRSELKKIFPVDSDVSLNQLAYSLGSEVRVLCTYNTTTSVRRFKLDEIIIGSPNWEPYNLYYNTWTETYTNIVL